MERKEVKDASEKSPRAAALFDLDGTLIPLPSLEKRFFQTLRYRREIPLRNYLWWLKEALSSLSRGFGDLRHANKMYLRGVTSLNCGSGLNPLYENDAENGDTFSARKRGRPKMLRACQAGKQTSTTPLKRARRNPRLPIPRFFEDGLDRVAWHASRGHTLVIVSGTLEPLAVATARELEAELAARGFEAKIWVCATKLEEIGGKWTGWILNEAMFGKAKERAVSKLAEELPLDLGRSYSYGDSIHDEAMLAIVGQPAAVNPSLALARIAQKRGWPMLRWVEERNLTERHRELREEEKGNQAKGTRESLPGQAERCA